jgi:hypothetical protein
VWEHYDADVLKLGLNSLDFSPRGLDRKLVEVK